MTPIELSNKVYSNEIAARKHLEAIRWPSGKPTCPLCGVDGESRPLKGKSMGAGWFYCEACQDKFTVRTGTVYERSHIPLHKWLLAFRLLASSKKGMSAHQLARTLDISYKSAWFLGHRVREAMRDTDPSPLGGKDKVVEADETFLGQQEGKYTFISGKGWVPMKGTHHKMKVLTLVERGGRSRSVKLDKLSPSLVREVLVRNADRKSRLHTDEAHHYTKVGREFASHETVTHWKKEYARGDVTVNTAESFFALFKRGMKGVYQHCSEAHLQKYLYEFDFRYSNRSALGVEDAERTTRAIKSAEGKRLTYRPPVGKAAVA